MDKLRFADPRPNAKSRSDALTPIENYILDNQKSKICRPIASSQNFQKNYFLENMVGGTKYFELFIFF